MKDQPVEVLADQIKRILADAVPDPVAREALRQVIIEFGKALIRQTGADAIEAVALAFEQVRREREL